jgi:hypothetical protein
VCFDQLQGDNVGRITESIERTNSYVIYGAQILAASAYTALNRLCGRKPRLFVVSDIKDNPSYIDGIKVIPLNDYTGDELIIIAAPPYFSEEIESLLDDKGFLRHITIDNDCENELMKEYYQLVSPERIPGSKAVNVNRPSIYMAKTCHDKSLKSICSHDKCVYEIQAGAALASEHISDLTDDTGDNISLKNGDYCEMTVTYWVWKNIRSEYKGICHYRRWWRLDDIGELNGYDVYLPYPNVYYPGAYVHHIRFVAEEMWDTFLEFFRGYDSALCNSFGEFEQGQYLSNYNMLIASNEVFNSYASWIFDILFSFEKYLSDRQIQPPKRYMGFFAENLTPFYFLYLHKELRVSYIGKDALI